MQNDTENQPELESSEKLLHDIATPLLITQMNTDLLVKHLPALIAAAKNAYNTDNNSDNICNDEQIITALLNAPNAIKNNLNLVQKKIRALTASLEKNNVPPAILSRTTISSPATKESPEPLQATKTTQLKTILLVDDEIIHQDIGLNLLSSNYDVDIANNGLEAITKCKQKHYDLILMDLQMPKMNGVEATEALRKMISTNTIIIGLTSMPIERKRSELQEIGFNYFLEKPLKLENLKKILSLVTIND